MTLWPYKAVKLEGGGEVDSCLQRVIRIFQHRAPLSFPFDFQSPSHRINNAKRQQTSVYGN